MGKETKTKLIRLYLTGKESCLTGIIPLSSFATLAIIALIQKNYVSQDAIDIHENIRSYESEIKKLRMSSQILDLIPSKIFIDKDYSPDMYAEVRERYVLKINKTSFVNYAVIDALENGLNISFNDLKEVL